MERQEWVGAIVVLESKILLGRRAATRAMHPNVWDVFGGHVEAGEDLRAALARELREELGITPTAFTRYTTWNADKVQAPGVDAYHLYLVTAWTGIPSNCQPDEHAEIDWFTLEQLQSLPLALASYLALFAAILHPPAKPHAQPVRHSWRYALPPRPALPDVTGVKAPRPK